MKRKDHCGTCAEKAGLPPGSLVYVGPESHPTTLHAIHYDANSFSARRLANDQELPPLDAATAVTWVDLHGLRDVEMLGRIGQRQKIHPLVMEDILHTGQRPKAELFDDRIFLVLKMVRATTGAPAGLTIEIEQVSLVLGPGHLLTFQEREGDVFEPVRQRLRAGGGQLRKFGPDYLAYALMDAVVDQYFTVVETIGEEIERLEDSLVLDPGPESMAELHRLRRTLIHLRRAVWPLRDAVALLLREEHALIAPATRPYLRDLHDHVIRVIETIETNREMVAGLLDIYLSSVSNRLNEVMKVLTIIATIFIPMTFLTGVYGMNFRHMPELEQWWGYPAVWLVNLAIAVAMLLFFRRKKWL